MGVSGSLTSSGGLHVGIVDGMWTIPNLEGTAGYDSKKRFTQIDLLFYRTYNIQTQYPCLGDVTSRLKIWYTDIMVGHLSDRFQLLPNSMVDIKYRYILQKL
jgi:hypothetical protein